MQIQNSNGWFDESQQMPQSSSAMKWLGILLVAFAPALYAQTVETNAVTVSSNAPTASTDIYADLAAPPAMTDANIRQMSLIDCVQVALEHNFDIKIFRYEPRIASYNLSGTYGAYDPVLSLGGEHDYNLSPGGVDAQGRSFGGTETDTDVLRGGLQGYLPWGLTYNIGARMADQTGTRPGTTIDPNNFTLRTNTVFDINNPNNPVGFTLSTNFATIPIRSPFETTSGDVGVLTMSQPLLKNFWIDSTRLAIYVNKKNLQISEVDFRDQVMDTVTMVETAYFNLMFFQENVRVQEKALQLADQLLQENKKRVEVGALAPLDEKQAEAQAASSRADLLQSEAQEATQERVLKALMSDSYTNTWATVSVLPTDKLIAIPQQYDLQESWRKGLAHGPRVQQLRLAVDKDKENVRFQRNQLFPQLDVIGSYGYNASSKEFSGALGQIRNGDNPFWSVGGQFSVPLSQTTARNNLKVAKASQEVSTLKAKQGEQGLLIQIENDIANARTDFERVSATREARLYAEAALDAEQKKLQNGKSTSFVVLQLQKNLTDARSAEIRALADYNISLARLSFDEGSVLERRRVNITWK